jgi:hypothetical protein
LTVVHTQLRYRGEPEASAGSRTRDERTADSRGQSEARPLGDGGGERRSCVASGGSQRGCVCCASWSGDLDARASTTTCTRTAYRVLGVHGRTSTTRHGHTTVDAKPGRVVSSLSIGVWHCACMCRSMLPSQLDMYCGAGSCSWMRSDVSVSKCNEIIAIQLSRSRNLWFRMVEEQSA